MLQVIQYQKKGNIVVAELPPPKCIPGGILVRTHYSLISAGTEKSSVAKAQSSIIERAKKQPEDVKLVLDFIKKEGIFSTYQRVKSKLDSYKSLGYSASGVVIESKSSNFKVGDRVAVAGAGYANHAELISVPENLAVKVPQDCDLKSAAYTTVASIALHGVRQADVRIGEKVAVIGLGLIGQITVQLLKASGCKVIGIDINESLFERAKSSGADMTCKSNDESRNIIKSFTSGLGCDSVLITAGTSSNQPIEFALDICRKKGKVVIVGAVGMNIPRTPFYMKEIDLKISCSYGPGRYDTYYEEKGIDYPFAYVRWTENRNMSSILELLADKKLNFEFLTTHTFNLLQAESAYNLVTGKVSEPFIGILLEYSTEKELKYNYVNLRKIEPADNLNVGFIGMGAFARNYLIPAVKEYGVKLTGVASQNPVNARSSAENLGFDFYSADGDDIINDDRVNLVFVASRHDSHFDYVLKSLKTNKPVFVEKPLAINQLQLDELSQSIQLNNHRLMVGFNRRFSKTFKFIKDFMANRSEPMVISYRVNAGLIPKSHWVQQIEQGGRIIGEVCHFIDTMIYLTDSKPTIVSAMAISSSNSEINDDDNISINIQFSDGSIGNIIYHANGDSLLPKEYCEVHCMRQSVIMNNFEIVTTYANQKRKDIKSDGKKGINEEIKLFLDAVKNGKEMPISFEDIYLVTKTTFAVNESLRTGKFIQI